MLVEDHLLAVARAHHDRDQVAQRPRREEDRGLLAQELGGHRLEQVDGGVLAEHVVADRRLRHEAAHLRRRSRRGVAAEVDQVGRGRRRGHELRVSLTAVVGGAHGADEVVALVLGASSPLSFDRAGESSESSYSSRVMAYGEEIAAPDAPTPVRRRSRPRPEHCRTDAVGRRARGARAGGRSRKSIFASLDLPQFRWLFASNTAFFLAMSGQSVLRSWLVFQITGNELALGLISALVALPMLLMAPVGGTFADRFDRRRVVAAGQLLVIGGELTVFALLVSGHLEYWHLLVMEALMGTAFPLIMPARQAIIANTVGRARLTNAMALNMAAVSTTRVVGPALAGFAIAHIGIARAYGANVVLYATALAAWSESTGRCPPASGEASRRA